MTTLTTSAAPSTASAASDRTSYVDTPNTMVASAEDDHRAEHGAPDATLERVTRESTDMASAPTAGAERSRPEAPGPVKRMSRA